MWTTPASARPLFRALLEAEGYRVGVLSPAGFHHLRKHEGSSAVPATGFSSAAAMWTVWWRTIRWQRSAAPRTNTHRAVRQASGRTAAPPFTRSWQSRLYPDLPVILGGLEASLRRFAHYDYWLDDVLPSIVESSGRISFPSAWGNARRRRLHGDWRPGSRWRRSPALRGPVI